MPINLACKFLGPNVTSTAQGTNHNVFRAPVTPLRLLIFLTPCGMNKVLLKSIELDHFNTQVTKSQVKSWLAVLDKTQSTGNATKLKQSKIPTSQYLHFI